MVNMSQRAQLHRILDNCILLSNSGWDVQFNFDSASVAIICKDHKQSLFSKTHFHNEMSFSDLVDIAENLEREMGVEI